MPVNSPDLNGFQFWDTCKSLVLKCSRTTFISFKIVLNTLGTIPNSFAIIRFDFISLFRETGLSDMALKRRSYVTVGICKINNSLNTMQRLRFLALHLQLVTSLREWKIIESDVKWYTNYNIRATYVS